MGLAQLLEKDKKTALLMGNEAIVRGALESAVSFATTYPGTPASEIGDVFYKISKKKLFPLKFEYSTNEKVALEKGYGHSLLGENVMVSMKQVGLNVALDHFLPLARVTGIGNGKQGSLVLVVAEDPAPWSSTSSQDNRPFYQHSLTLEPSNVNECMDYTRKAFKISEENGIVVVLRTVMETNHQYSDVQLGELKAPNPKLEFIRDQGQRVSLASHAREFEPKMKKKLEMLGEKLAQDFIKIEKGDGKFGIITAGNSYNYVKEALLYAKLKEKPSIMKIGLISPWPEKQVREFSRSLEEVLVVEELTPYMELRTKAATEGTQVHGKDLLKSFGEFSCEEIIKALVQLGWAEPDMDYEAHKLLYMESAKKVAKRHNLFCPGCPHRGTLIALKKATKDMSIFGGDIGCYGMAVNPPYKKSDWKTCMSGGLGVAGGTTLAKILMDPEKGKEKQDPVTIAMIGDSTYYHSGIEPLLDAVTNNNKLLLVIFDNSWTALTGHQPTPSTPYEQKSNKKVSLESIAKGLGVEYIKITDPFDIKKARKDFEQAISFVKNPKSYGPAVVISRAECELTKRRREGKKDIVYQIDAEACNNCDVCRKECGCSPIRIGEAGEHFIDEENCTGCGICKDVCQNDAIMAKEKQRGRD